MQETFNSLVRLSTAMTLFGVQQVQTAIGSANPKESVEKLRAVDNEDILLTERGTCFGYHYLINDMRSLPAMRMHLE